MDAQKTGGLISAARREKGLTQKELAQALHVSAQAVSKWERGLNFPDLALLGPLGDLLGLTVSELLSGTRGEEPKEELLRDSLRVLPAQLGGKVRRWRRAALACLGVLLALALGGGAWYVKNHTELLPQPATVISPIERTEQDQLVTRAAGLSDVYLYDLTVADGTEHYQVQLEYWTSEGLVRTWPAAEAYDPSAPRHQIIGFSCQRGKTPLTMDLTVSLDQGTWKATLEEVPALDLGYTMNVLDRTCEADPEYGAVLACWSLAMEEGPAQPEGGEAGSPALFRAPNWTGAVEAPQADDGARFLLLRLTVS